MDAILGALLVFGLRITDVSIGTMRVIYTIRGRRFRAAGLGFIEASVFLFAIAWVFKDMGYAKMIGYAGGFAAGTLLGITVEGWIASGFVIARIISRVKSNEIREQLQAEDFGVTAVAGEGRSGPLLILFVVAARRRSKQLLEVVQAADPTAFITLDPVTRAIGGYIPHVVAPTSVRK